MWNLDPSWPKNLTVSVRILIFQAQLLEYDALDEEDSGVNGGFQTGWVHAVFLQ